MADNPPYLLSSGSLTKALEKLKVAATPTRFTQDFLNTKLKMKGGSANALIPYLKKIGFLGPDGTPTGIYERFRNPTFAGAALAEATRHGYRSLYEVNEYAHDLSDEELKGLIVQVTGMEKKDRVAQAIFSTFKVLNDGATFDAVPPVAKKDLEKAPLSQQQNVHQHSDKTLNLSYTINLNLPATTNAEVFNAIFKSLKEHLLDNE